MNPPTKLSSVDSGKITDKIKVHFKFIKEDHYFNEEKNTRNIYKVYVKYNGKAISFSFGDSLNNTKNGIKLDDKKDKNGILENMYSDYYMTPENYPTLAEFSNEFGYEGQPNNFVRKIYKRCMVQGTKLHKLLTSEEMEQVREELDF